ncbi:MAG: MaoC family dehydratase N-terminal domain-containing protein [Proteobacteria bacterium]|nr:MaoC family dehydratase N-terminal domain-containing protein [Pseudomonadota bacterium]MBU2516031.1 MaoC family dehydratase N-terminal domain-containing protein [Pseudomonadota bacterium]
MRSLFYEEFEVGAYFETRCRTITEADIVAFAGLSWDFNSIHTDKEYAKDSIFGERIAHGALGFVVHTGLSATLGHLADTVVAFMGMTWNFHKPIKIGDTIHVEQYVKSKKDINKDDMGIVVFDTKLVNQKGEVVQQGDKTLLVRKKGLGE